MLLKLSFQNISFLEHLSNQRNSPIEYILLDFIKYPNHVNLYWPAELDSGDYPVDLHPIVIKLITDYYLEYYQKSEINEKHFIYFLSAVVNFRLIRYKRLASINPENKYLFQYNRKYNDIIEQYGISRLARWAGAIGNFKQRGLFSLNLTSVNLIESWTYSGSKTKNSEKLNWLLFRLYDKNEITKDWLFGKSTYKTRRTKKYW